MRGWYTPMKIYGYTDRGLYKAGETIHMAGFVRDTSVFTGVDYLQGKTVSISVRSPSREELFMTGGLSLDRYG